MYTRNEIVVGYKLAVFGRAGLVMTRRMLSDATGLSKYKIAKACERLKITGVITETIAPYRSNNHMVIYAINPEAIEYMETLHNGQF